MWAALLLAIAVASASPSPSIGFGEALENRLQDRPLPPETIAAIQIHGNTITSDDEIRRLAGVEIGSRVDETLLADVAARLRAAKRFENVQVLKRFASIADPSQVLLVIIVDEGPVRIERPDEPGTPVRVVRRHRLNLMLLPILGYEDGYGLTYGVRLARTGIAGPQSRLSFPLTWGGEKKAGVELDKTITHGPVDRILAGLTVSRRTNPFFDEDDDRAHAWMRAERKIAPSIRAGGTAGRQRVWFGEDEDGDSFAYVGADIVFDTRIDPLLPRNAVYARAAVERLSVGSGMTGSELEGRGYAALVGQSVLALRVLRQDSSGALPPYLKALLGGLSNLRGFAAGTAAGDTLFATSAEVILPFTSPLKVGKAGASVFVDSATAYNVGARLIDQPLRVGYGGSLWVSAAFARLNVAIAHGRGSSTRVHVGGSLSF
jgi:outer membrane protein assembly factor BamA